MARDTRILTNDPETGIVEYFHYDDVDDTFTIERTQSLELDTFNPELYNRASDVKASRWKGDFHHVASIPMSIYAEWVQTGMIHDQAAIKRWLDDPDNRVFRTKPGRLG